MGDAAGDKTSGARHSSPAPRQTVHATVVDATDREKKISESELGKPETVKGGEGGKSGDGDPDTEGRGDADDTRQTAKHTVAEKSERERDDAVEKGAHQTEGSVPDKDGGAKESKEESVKDAISGSGAEVKEGKDRGETKNDIGEPKGNAGMGRQDGEMGEGEMEVEKSRDEQREASEEELAKEDGPSSALMPSSTAEDKTEGNDKGTAKEMEDNEGRHDQMEVDLPHGTRSTTANKTAEQLKPDTDPQASGGGEQKDVPEPMLVESAETADKGKEIAANKNSASEERPTDTPAPSSTEARKDSKPDVAMAVADEDSPNTAVGDPAHEREHSAKDEVVESKAAVDESDAANDSDRNVLGSSSPKRPRRASQRNLRSQLPNNGNDKMDVGDREDEKKVDDETKGEESERKDGKEEEGKVEEKKGTGDADVDAGGGKTEEKEEAMKKIAQLLEDLPRPEMTEHGTRMKLGEALFATYDQLEEVKKKRMHDKNLTPIEKLTFAEVASFNRDQLRCYCYIYGTPRRKKSEMEIDMAMFVCLWHRGEEGYVLPDYIPKNSRERIGEKAAISAYEMGVELAKEPPPLSATPEKSDGDHVEVLRPSRRSSGNSRSELSRDSQEGFKTPLRSGGRISSRVPGKMAGKTPAAGFMPTSAKRPPPRPQNNQAIQPSPMRHTTHQSQVGTERVVSRGGVAGSSMQNIELQKQMHMNMQGASTTGRSQVAGTTRTSRSGIPVQPMPQGFGTSFKQKIHARAAGEKFKAAYNGAGPSMVNVVENAAAYFTGKDSPEVIQDQAKSYARYQFNVDLLSEIFDGAPPQEDQNRMDIDRQDVPNRRPEGVLKANAMREVAKRMRSSSSPGYDEAELERWEASFKQLESNTKETERANMRLFQRLERAETEEEIESVKRDFERYHDVRIDGAPPPLVRRKLDKSLTPVLMPDNQCRILRFKVA